MLNDVTKREADFVYHNVGASSKKFYLERALEKAYEWQNSNRV